MDLKWFSGLEKENDIHKSFSDFLNRFPVLEKNYLIFWKNKNCKSLFELKKRFTVLDLSFLNLSCFKFNFWKNSFQCSKPFFNLKINTGLKKRFSSLKNSFSSLKHYWRFIEKEFSRLEQEYFESKIIFWAQKRCCF